MTTVWTVRNRYFTAVQESPLLLTGARFRHTLDPSFDADRLPWADPEYPALLILGFGFEYTTSAVAGTRQVEIMIGQVIGSFQTFSTGTQAAGQTRRWEFWAGFELDTTPVGNLGYKEPLPKGLIALPGPNDGVETQIDVFMRGADPGDMMGPVTMSGALLLP